MNKKIMLWIIAVLLLVSSVSARLSDIPSGYSTEPGDYIFFNVANTTTPVNLDTTTYYDSSAKPWTETWKAGSGAGTVDNGYMKVYFPGITGSAFGSHILGTPKASDNHTVSTILYIPFYNISDPSFAELEIRTYYEDVGNTANTHYLIAEFYSATTDEFRLYDGTVRMSSVNCGTTGWLYYNTTFSMVNYTYSVSMECSGGSWTYSGTTAGVEASIQEKTVVYVDDAVLNLSYYLMFGGTMDNLPLDIPPPPPTAPSISKVYPTEAQYLNNYNGFLNFTITSDTAINVTWVNDTAWTLNYSNGTDYRYFNPAYASLPDGNYKINITANDSDGDIGSAILTFTIDTSPPNVLTNLEGNNTYWTYLMNLQINSTVTDNLDYIFYNDSCGNTFFNTSISAPYTYNEHINISACSIGQQQTNITVCDLASNCVTPSYLWNSRGRLNITANSGVNGSAISSFSIYLNGTLAGSTSTGVYTLNNLTEDIHNITIDPTGYQVKTESVNINSSFQTHNFILATTNSINITIYDETTGALITSTNVSIRFSSTMQEWTNETSTGNIYLDNLVTEEYSLLFTTDTYSSRTYTITVSNRSSQNLKAYLSQNTSTTLFTITDQDTAAALESVLGTIYRMMGSEWQPIESKYSDITGKVQFTYIEDTKYKFYFFKEGYEDYIFYLDPVLFSSYDISLDRTTSLNVSQDHDRIAIAYYPSVFYSDIINNFSLIIQSPFGELISYGYNITYPGGSNSTSGSNAIGGQLSVQFNITGASYFEQVELIYWYETTISGVRTFTYYFPIVPSDRADGTFIANRDETYGLGVFERILIITVLVLFVVGIATLTGHPLEGAALGLLVFGFFAYNGFIPLWGVLPSMFIGLMLLALKGS